jgi:predicted phage-related endonuclease
MELIKGECLENREQYIGASDISAILGFSKYYKSAYEFAQIKLGLKVQDKKFLEPYAEQGHTLEPKIRDYVNEMIPTNYEPMWTVKEPFRVNYDGVDLEAERPVLEIKVRGKEVDIDLDSYQVKTQLWILGQKQALFAVYERESVDNNDFDPHRLQTYEIVLDDEFESMVIPVIENFVNAYNALSVNNNLTEQEFNEIYLGKKLVKQTARLTRIEEQAAKLKAKADELRAEILSEMEQRGIKKAANYTYVAGAPAAIIQAIDELKVREEYPYFYLGMLLGLKKEYPEFDLNVLARIEKEYPEFYAETIKELRAASEDKYSELLVDKRINGRKASIRKGK